MNPHTPFAHALRSLPRSRRLPGSPSASLVTQCLRSNHPRTRSLAQPSHLPDASLKHASFTTQSRSYATSAPPSPIQIRRTALYDFHVENGGKMVPFGGFSMPVQYTDLGITASHLWTREKASLFDVSHMVQHRFSGPGAADFLALITPCSPADIKPFHAGLSALLNEDGGIVDDTIVTSLSELGDHQFYVVTNAGCREKDLAYFKRELAKFEKQHPDKPVVHRILDTHGLVALQGPLAKEILLSLAPVDAKTGKPVDFDELLFGRCAFVDLPAIRGLLVSRGGYTGEDGFEISVPPSIDGEETAEHPVVTFTKLLLDTAGKDKLRLAGLGARDSLRLEAGMCLYGHDIDENTTPVEGGLSWIISKERREKGGFYGAEKILQQLRPVKEGGGVARRRVGLVVNDPAPAREGAEIVDKEGKKVGVVTSGGPSPSLGKNIAMGYVETGHHKTGTELGVVVRKKTRPAVVSKMPFVPAKYWRGPSEVKK